MFAHTSNLMGKTAAVLGNESDAACYRELSAEVAEAFRRKFLDAEGVLNIRSQTACVLALQFDLLTPDQKEKNAALLESLIRENGNKLSTGFVGTAWLNQALTRSGRTHTAYDLLLQEEYPSWLFSVNQGATTIWERWNSYTVKDGFGDVNMNSFNHYAYGAVVEWMAATAGGIDCLEEAPGGKVIVFAAEPDRRLGFADCSLETPYGRAESAWRYDGERLVWRISAPCNTRMKVLLPVADAASVSCSGISPEKFAGMENGRVSLELENGCYEFIMNPVGS
jgi:Bacterial alpha-L-rhamnosidase.